MLNNRCKIKLSEFLLHDLADDFFQPVILFGGKDGLHEKRFALAGWDLREDGPRLPLLRVIQVGAENVLGLFHASL